jgi:2-oxoisovalerate dehydrogenase E1 component alpha subunit
MAHQLVGNKFDLGKGKQMPIHYGSKDINIVTVSSPLCTQVPQASGCGYNYRIQKQDRIAVTYFGEGSASEGDFHPALNFAATLRCQTLFFCRNNMYAISTPIDDQYAGDGIAVRGVSYGMPTIRVDGNDLFAIYFAVQEARKIILRDKMPVLIEAISYRQGDHSTSDFSQRYRDEEEMKKWKELLEGFTSPIERMDKYLTKRGLITPERTAEVRLAAKNSVRDALKNAIGEVHPEIDLLFEEVYDKMPKHIEEQRDQLREHLKKYPEEYELHKFKNGKDFLN